MKKVLSVLLSLVMLFSVSFAFADDALSFSTYASDLVINYTSDGETETIDLTGLSTDEKLLLGKNGLEGLWDLKVGGEDVLNIAAQLTEEGMLYFGADQLSKVFSVDMRAVISKVYSALAEAFESVMESISEEDVEDFLESVQDTIEEAAEEIKETLKEVFANSEISISVGNVQNVYGDKTVDCDYMEVTLSGVNGEKLFGTSIDSAVLTLYVDSADEPSYLTVDLEADSDGEVIFDGELDIIEVADNSYTLDLSYFDETILSGSYVEDNNGAFTFSLAGGTLEFDAFRTAEKLEVGGNYTVGAELKANGASLCSFNASHNVDDKNISLTAEFDVAQSFTGSAAFTGTYTADDDSVVTSGKFEAELAAGEDGLSCSFDCGFGLSDKDETIDLSTRDLYEIDSISSLEAIFEDEAFSSELSSLLISVMIQLSGVPAISELVSGLGSVME